MAFQKAPLLAALLASAALVKGAPFRSSCDLDLHHWGTITYNGHPLSVSSSGKIVVGGKPQQFASAVCSEKDTGDRNLIEQSKGYLVDAYNPSQCVTASNLDQKGATFSFEPCMFNGQGIVSASQSFAWIFDNDGFNTAPTYFNGENGNVVNSTNPGIYSFRTQRVQPSFDGAFGNLLVDYTPNLTSLPDNHLEIPLTNVPVTPQPQPYNPSLSCSTRIRGQVIFNNQTSTTNGYDGPVNSKWIAQSDTTDKFIFEECDYSSVGLKPSGDSVYGRIRPATDVADGSFNCYTLFGDLSYDDTTHEPLSNSWISGLQEGTCSYTVDGGKGAVKYNKSDKSFDFLPFGNGTQPGGMYWYSQLDYDREYGVNQYVYSPPSVGQVYLSKDNANLTKYPPAKVTLKQG